MLSKCVIWVGVSLNLCGEIGIFKESSSYSKENTWVTSDELSTKRPFFSSLPVERVYENLDIDVCTADLRWWNEAYY